MAEWIIQAGKIAGAISAIFALIALIVWRPAKRFLKSLTDMRDGEKEFRKQVLKKLDDIVDDIGDLQYERLSQAHDFYVHQQKWCPASKKQQLCQMHKSYSAKGRNHLSKHYEDEIMALPEKPEKE